MGLNASGINQRKGPLNGFEIGNSDHIRKIIIWPGRRDRDRTAERVNPRIHTESVLYIKTQSVASCNMMVIPAGFWPVASRSRSAVYFDNNNSIILHLRTPNNYKSERCLSFRSAGASRQNGNPPARPSVAAAFFGPNLISNDVS